MSTAEKNQNPQLISAVARRGLLLAGLWWLLNAGDIGSWVVGIPAVLFAALISVKLTAPRPWRWRPLALLRFTPFFIVESLRGGWDVSLRVLRPSLPINPGVLLYTTQLPEGMPRLLLVIVVSLLPGTLSADIRGNQLTLHVLDNNAPVAAELFRLESRIGSLFRFKPHGEQL